jgi:Family of unknown function (DUF6998)
MSGCGRLPDRVGLTCLSHGFQTELQAEEHRPPSERLGGNHVRAAPSGSDSLRNNPTGDLAEALVAEFYGVEPEANSTAGYDLRLSDGTRVQVKGRRRTRRSKPSHYGLIRKLDQDPFDVLVVVNLDEEFAVESAFRMPIDVVRELAGFSTHTNAWRLPIIQGSRATHPGVEQITLGPQ